MIRTKNSTRASQERLVAMEPVDEEGQTSSLPVSILPLHREYQAEESHCPVVLVNCRCGGEEFLPMARPTSILSAERNVGITNAISVSFLPSGDHIATRITQECSPVGGRERKGTEKGRTNEDGSAIYAHPVEAQNAARSMPGRTASSVQVGQYSPVITGLQLDLICG
ncbi:hypothetical protein ARMSODRAFT_980404 [Armillaria solidipes]|uniref:Uncharacterized protein n=1 Tax=Armillaria solidipes TaxID=1076256 RepID=A0A2H3B6U9_9AGAR|nr:hypothetical protein ARMSODRAFT_980895 [Armillaria solidipes]PBK62752.1 hypothetical protein ARMSODRAFT_980404 [Armillaria solidipes]